MKTFTFSFKVSGKDADGKAIAERTLTLPVKASTEDIARKRLRAQFHKNVVITVISVS